MSPLQHTQRDANAQYVALPRSAPEQCSQAERLMCPLAHVARDGLGATTCPSNRRTVGADESAQRCRANKRTYALPDQRSDVPPFAGSRVLLIVDRLDISGRFDWPQCITGDTLRRWLMYRSESYATTAVRSLIAWLVVNA